MAEHHQATNYWAVWIWLAVLTVLEVGVTLIPELATLYKAILLVALAVGKALLVALYFMHLRFETRTLGAIVLTPLRDLRVSDFHADARRRLRDSGIAHPCGARGFGPLNPGAVTSLGPRGGWPTRHGFLIDVAAVECRLEWHQRHIS